MNDDKKIKKNFPNLDGADKEFKEKMAVLRKKQSLILGSFSKKAEAERLEQLRKNLTNEKV